MAKVLSLAIDAAGMRIGAQEAERALQQVDAASARTARSLDIYGASSRVFRNSLDESTLAAKRTAQGFGAVSEALSVSGRVRFIAGEFSELGVGMDSVARIGPVVAAGLLDTAQALERLRQLRLIETGAEAATGFKAFASAIAGNPLLVASVAIGGIAAAMALFKGNTEAATKQTKDLLQQVQRLNDAKVDVDYRRAIGRPIDPRELARSEADRIGAAYRTLRESRLGISPDELAKVAGSNVEDVRAVLGTSNPFKKNANIDPASIRQGQGLFETTYNYTNEAALKYLEGRGRFFERRPLEAVGATFGSDLPTPTPDPSRLREWMDALREETRLAGLSRDEREKAVAVYQAEQLARQEGIALTGAESAAIRENIDLQRQLSDLRDIGQQAGEVVGNGLFRIAQNARNAREALVGVLQQLAAIAQQRIVAGFGNAVANAFAGTASQARADVALPSGASPVGPYADGYR